MRGMQIAAATKQPGTAGPLLALGEAVCALVLALFCRRLLLCRPTPLARLDTRARGVPQDAAVYGRRDCAQEEAEWA